MLRKLYFHSKEYKRGTNHCLLMQFVHKLVRPG
jgi:hypothetical protein